MGGGNRSPGRALNSTILRNTNRFPSCVHPDFRKIADIASRLRIAFFEGNESEQRSRPSLGGLSRSSNRPMKYNLWIDNRAAGPFDVCQITELFLNGTITQETQIRLEGDEQTESWKPLSTTFPSITTLPTRSDTMQVIFAEIRSTKVPLSPHPQRVTVADFDMGFGSMVVFMVKWAIAAIPAAIILFALFFTITALLGRILLLR